MRKHSDLVLEKISWSSPQAGFFFWQDSIYSMETETYALMGPSLKQKQRQEQTPQITVPDNSPTEWLCKSLNFQVGKLGPDEATCQNLGGGIMEKCTDVNQDLCKHSIWTGLPIVG